MESASQKIISIIEEILALLVVCDEPDCKYYYGFLEYTLSQLNKPHVLHDISENVLKTYGGMATFSDVVIYKDGKPLEKENDEFYKLRTKLYLACEEVVATSRGATN